MVADLGLAGFVGDADGSVTYLNKYTSDPLVLRLQRRFDTASDVYSFGAMCFELAIGEYDHKVTFSMLEELVLAGKNPFSALSPVHQRNAQRLPQLFLELVAECLVCDASLRPSFAQITSTLQPLLK